MAKDQPGLAAAYRYASLGMQFAAGLLLFMGLGFLVDRRFGLMPVGTVAGALLGTVLSFLSVYRKVVADTEAARRRREGSG